MNKREKGWLQFFLFNGRFAHNCGCREERRVGEADINQLNLGLL